ncbi:hypothetical protein GU926_10980 [Nibribacter ruber]|uniref:Uncharacterized protein n=1 Tax=Nibribacter ruber TaxID=2698458 RepID=A0A6P1P065_9BACT|nr:hypothetical protein [Nibribacter ruber]QHL87925.1 hypothetical protein GU926_10980 [Nibribacter ruber]
MTISLPLLLALAVLLGAWLTWEAVRRADRRRLAGRIVASWVAVGCLALLVSPPSITRTYSATEAILLTEGYSSDTLTSVLKTLSPKPKVFSYDVKADRATQITDFTQFKARNPAVQTVHFLGHGLEEETLTELGNVQVIPHLSRLPTGVLSAFWPHKITLGEEVKVQGKFTSADQPTKLYLQAAGANRDSIEFKKGAEQPFEFRFRPKASGRFVYHLQWKGADDSVYQEAIPVTVQEPRKLAVLILASSPSFEVKFLKNALAQRGHGVALRTQVSKGIFQTELVNLPALSLTRITAPLLQKVDVVLLDAAMLQGLTGVEKQLLQQAVRQRGVGLLTSFPGSDPKQIPFFSEAVFTPIPEKTAKNALVIWDGETASTATLPITSFAIKPLGGQQTLVWRPGKQQALAVRSRKGLGQVGVSVMPETFPLALEGKERLYQSYWASMLSSLAAPLEVPAVLVLPNLASVQEPVSVTLSAGNTSIDRITHTATGKPVSLVSSASALFTNRKTFQLWPQTPGWHSLALPDNNLPFYFYPSAAWKTYQLHQRQQALLKKAQVLLNPARNTDITRQEPLPLWPFALVLLTALGFLWVEEKL